MSVEKSPETAAIDELAYLRQLLVMNALDCEAVLPSRHDAIMNGIRLHYLDWGTSGKTPIVLLHGGGLTAHTWDVVSLSLRGAYHCVALDQRGHGESEWSRRMDYSREGYVADLEAFVDHLGFDKFILVGMSLGGLNGIAYAGRHSQRLHSLVIIDVGPDMNVEGSKAVRDFLKAEAEFASIDDAVERSLSFNPRRDPNLLRRSLLYNLHQLPDGKWTWKYDRRHRMYQDTVALAEERRGLWRHVPAIGCPALVMRGAESKAFTQEDAEKLCAALPNGKFVTIERAGHTVQGDNPTDLIAELRVFLNGINQA